MRIKADCNDANPLNLKWAVAGLKMAQLLKILRAFGRLHHFNPLTAQFTLNCRGL